VLAEGPYGALTGARRRQRKALLIAGGVGITPLRALFQTLPAAAGDLTLVYRVSSHDDVLFRRELDTIAAARGARLHVVAGRRDELGHDPLSAAALMANIPDLRQHDVYLCGPVGMTESALRSLRAAKVPRTQIHHEAFGF
jgi:ferredoxin-NADP reductase